MSRALFVDLDEGRVVLDCLAANVHVSAIERLPQGGVRLVCSSSEGAATMIRKFKKHLLPDTVAREKFRPTRPLW
jgi:hypothetical protein